MIQSGGVANPSGSVGSQTFTASVATHISLALGFSKMRRIGHFTPGFKSAPARRVRYIEFWDSPDAALSDTERYWGGQVGAYVNGRGEANRPNAIKRLTTTF